MSRTAPARDWLARELGWDEAVVDRVAAALALAHGHRARDAADPHPDLDALPDGPALRPCLEELGSPDVGGELGRAVAAGREVLADLLERHDHDADRVLAALLRHPGGSPRTGAQAGQPALTVPVGVAEDGGVRSFTLNLEGGHQTNGNTRITGQPGMGKSQFLLHLLAAATSRSADLGFVLLDYKGDLASEQGFVRACGATVIRPERSPIPVNPFDVPPSVDSRLVPAAIAETIASLGRGVGDVQRMLLRKGIAAAYATDAALGHGGGPSSVDIASAVHEVYAAEDRSADSVTALLEQLAELGLFTTATDVPVEAFLRRRLVIDLSQLQSLRDLVAFVLVGWLARQVESLPDAPLVGGSWRSLRTVVAIDEAHHYIARRCRPLLDLLRVGRSKGVPVVLSSQSLEDFRGFTELEEFLPSNFVLRQGRVPDARMVQAALRLDAAAGKRALGEATRLDQFRALVTLDPTAPGETIGLHGFFAGRWRP